MTQAQPRRPDEDAHRTEKSKSSASTQHKKLPEEKTPPAQEAPVETEASEDHEPDKPKKAGDRLMDYTG